MATRRVLRKNVLTAILPSWKKPVTSEINRMSTVTASNHTAEDGNIDDGRRREPPTRQTDVNNLRPDVPVTGRSLSGRSRGEANVRRPWDAKEDEEAFRLRLDMPGLGKEEVKVQVEDDVVVIRGEGEAAELKCNSRIRLPRDVFKIDEIQANMENGVLQITVPKLPKEEVAKNVINVKVE